MRKAELLAPAGSAETVKAAFAMGADAVYIGGQRFGARAYADNADTGALLECMDLAHLLDRKLYLTVNTLLKDQELEQELYDYLLPFYEHGLDAIIVQDVGVLEFCHKHFPQLPLHASTQMTITGSESAAMLQKYGITRVVPARELSLPEIREIYDRTGMEIECFVHGALCYSYSGQCLMSSMIGGRSGNRGRCAGTCRLPYEVWQRGKRLGAANMNYPLNTKDMCTLELLPQILDAGVCSLKIEGRMKRSEYTAGVVSVYRKYLDLCEQSRKSYHVDQADLRFLYDLFNRDGFHQSYFLMEKGPEMMALRNEKLSSRAEQNRNQMYDSLQKEWKSRSLQRGIEGSFCMEAGMPCRLELGLPITRDRNTELPENQYISQNGRELLCIQAEGPAAEAARGQALTEERVKKQLNKTGQEAFFFEKLDLTLKGELFMPIRELNELRRGAMLQLKEKVLQSFARTAAFSVIEEPDTGEKEKGACWPLPIWAHTETREQVRELTGQDGIYGVGISMTMLKPDSWMQEFTAYARELDKCGQKVRLLLPYVYRKKSYGNMALRLSENAESRGRSRERGNPTGKDRRDSRGKEGVLPYRWTVDQMAALCKDVGNLDAILVRNIEEAALLAQKVPADELMADAGLYMMNNRSMNFWKAQGIFRNTVPWELNFGELLGRENGQSEMILYGAAPMMISEQCLKRNLDHCTRSGDHLLLRDRKGKNFPVVCVCSACYNIIYNCVPQNLLSEAGRIRRLGCQSLRLSFSTEKAEETRKAAKSYVSVYKEGKPPVREGEMTGTRGHFRRGVE